MFPSMGCVSTLSYNLNRSRDRVHVSAFKVPLSSISVDLLSLPVILSSFGTSAYFGYESSVNRTSAQYRHRLAVLLHVPFRNWLPAVSWCALASVYTVICREHRIVQHCGVSRVRICTRPKCHTLSSMPRIRLHIRPVHLRLNLTAS